jgi:hypothetical protein
VTEGSCIYRVAVQPLGCPGSPPRRASNEGGTVSWELAALGDVRQRLTFPLGLSRLLQTSITHGLKSDCRAGTQSCIRGIFTHILYPVLFVLLFLARALVRSDSDAAIPFYILLLSSLGSFMVYFTIQDSLERLDSFLFPFMITAGLDIVFRGPPAEST